MMLSNDEEAEYLELLELEHMERAKNNLDDYCRYIEIPGAPMKEDSCPDNYCDDPNCNLHEVSNSFYADTVEPAEHHKLLNDVLMKVEAKAVCEETGHIYNRVMVFMPPGSAKSTYASVTFPTWYMGRNPNKNIIGVSYACSLAKKFGRKCRSIATSEKYNTLFDTGLKSENRAVDDWALDNNSTFMCGGILSGITGNRADGIFIDDPVKGRVEADSPTTQESTWEAYKSDIRSRLKPSGWILIIQTRWNENDLSGKILPETWDGESGWVIAQDGEPWFVISLPAQCDRHDDPLGRKIGDWLWTSWFSAKHWMQEKKTQGSRNWNALYQCKPAPDDGNYYKKGWFKRFNLKHKPPNMTYYLCADYAVSDDATADFTEIGVFGVDEKEDIYIVDWHQGQEEVSSWIKQLVKFIKLYKPILHCAEKGVIRRATESLIRKEMRKESSFTQLEWLTAAGDKPAMGRSFQALAENGVIHVANEEWGDDLVDQLKKFPAGKYDDKADACAQFGQIIDVIWGARNDTESEHKPVDRYDNAWDDEEGSDSWKFA